MKEECDCDVPGHIHFPLPESYIDPEAHAFVRPRWWRRLRGYSMCRICDCPIGWHR